MKNDVFDWYVTVIEGPKTSKYLVEDTTEAVLNRAKNRLNAGKRHSQDKTAKTEVSEADKAAGNLRELFRRR